MKEKTKMRWKIVGITLLTAILGGLFSRNSAEFYETLVKPPLAPPSSVFPIVWGVLYVAMALSLILYYNKQEAPSPAFGWYTVNLVLNALWPLFFFSLQMIGFAIFILLALIVVNLILLGELKKVTWAFYLYLPYLLWQIFALYLNLSIWLLN